MLGAAILATVLACAPAAPPKALTPVVVQLSWKHGAQFAGLYAAEQRGHYSAEGLAVRFVEADTRGAIPPVVSGEAQFGLAPAYNLIQARADGTPTRAVASVYRRTPTVFMTLGSSGITRPEQFAGKTIHAGAGAIPTLAAMTAKVGVRRAQYTVINAGTDLGRFYSGEVQVWTSWVMDQPLAARRAGHAVNLVRPDDYGVHGYGEMLFARDDVLAASPALVTGFVRASLAGWTFAVENPVEAAALVRLYRPDADLGIETEFLTASLPLINTGADRVGWMNPETWEAMAQTLRVYGVLRATLPMSDVYTLQFVESAIRSR